MNKQYTFSLPEEVGDIIGSLPKTEKSKYVANAIINQEKIEAKRKQTPWRDFVKQIASWQPNVFYKVDGLISRFPSSERIGKIVKYSNYYEQEGEAYTKGYDYDNQL